MLGQPQVKPPIPSPQTALPSKKQCLEQQKTALEALLIRLGHSREVINTLVSLREPHEPLPTDALALKKMIEGAANYQMLQDKDASWCIELLSYASCEFLAHEILPHVYLGSLDAALTVIRNGKYPHENCTPHESFSRDSSILLELNIHSICTVGRFRPKQLESLSSNLNPNKLKKNHFFQSDDEQSWCYETQELDACFKMIDEARQTKTNILIHCNLGMNRSTTVLALYIIHRFKIYDVDKVLGYMQSRRAICRPSSRVNYPGLKEYAEKVSRQAASSASSGAAALASGAAMTSRERAEAMGSGL